MEPNEIPMRHEQELKFINGGAARLLLVVEPASSEFWIDSRASVKVLVEAPAESASVEIEYLAGGIVMYLPEHSAVQVFQNGRRLAQGKRTRHMDTKLTQSRSSNHAGIGC